MSAKLKWVVGDAPALWGIHNDKPWMSTYGVIKVLESLLRGFGQVCFANNPWSGMLIFLGLLLFQPLVALGAILASVASLMMSRILQQPDSVVVSGLQNYSAVIIGTCSVALFPVFFEGEIGVLVWVGIFVMGALSVCVGIGLGVLLSTSQLPVFTLPFNVTTSLLFLSLHSSGFSSSAAIASSQSNATDGISIGQVFGGSLKAFGQVYGVEDVTASSMILVGLLLNSPFLTLMSFIGGLISTLLGLLVSSPPYSPVYAGVWGYNGFLAGGCFAFFLVPNFTSVLLGVLNAVFTAFIQTGLLPLFQDHKLPVFTFPFCLASLLLLAAVQIIPSAQRVIHLTFPEDHYFRNRNKTSTHNENKIMPSCAEI